MVKLKITYEDAVHEIEEILNEIEHGDLDVDKLSEKVKRVTILIKHCKSKLQSTEEEINAILGDQIEEKE